MKIMAPAEQKSSRKSEVMMDGVKLVHESVSYKGTQATDIGTDYNFKRKIVWKNAIGFLFLHLAGLYGIYLCYYSVATAFWGFFMAIAAAEGVTIGAHRFYSHKAFKAKPSVRFWLILLQTIAGQNCLYIWVRDHRQHHKYSDTDADPHNAHRGFFFSHVGWLMSKKHPAVIEKGKNIDLSDLEADWMVMFQKKYYKPLYAIFAIGLPVIVPVYFWNETYWNSFFISYLARYILQLNATWLVNSAAHLYGTRPFDKYLLPVESHFVAFVSIGEGWHNYHHTFPWDYRAAELGSKYNVTTFVIDVLAHFGLVYDLKSAPHRMIEQRALKSGDGTHHVFGIKQFRINQQKSISDKYILASEADNKKMFNGDIDKIKKYDIRVEEIQRKIAAHG